MFMMHINYIYHEQLLYILLLLIISTTPPFLSPDPSASPRSLCPCFFVSFPYHLPYFAFLKKCVFRGLGI